MLMQNRFFLFCFPTTCQQPSLPHPFYRILKRIYICDLALNKILLKNFKGNKQILRISKPSLQKQSRIIMATIACNYHLHYGTGTF